MFAKFREIKNFVFHEILKMLFCSHPNFELVILFLHRQYTRVHLSTLTYIKNIQEREREKKNILKNNEHPPC